MGLQEEAEGDMARAFLHMADANVDGGGLNGWMACYREQKNTEPQNFIGWVVVVLV